MMSNCQYQFELWEECNSCCSFCYLGNNNKKTSSSQKLDNLAKTLNKISDDSFYQGVDCIGYIGGEFFQGQLNDVVVKESFMKLMSKTNESLTLRKINEAWISASLLIGDQADLFQTIDIFNENTSKLWILTSYDTIGRFHSSKEENDWMSNLSKIRNRYPDININITSIVTGDFIEKYLSKNLKLYDIASQFKCSVFLKPPAIIEGNGSKASINDIVGNFFPRRNCMLQFLSAYRLAENEFMYDKLFNMTYRADYLELYGHRQKFSHRIKDQHKEEVGDCRSSNSLDHMSSFCSTCGHSVQYQCYIDSPRCLICDKDMIQNSLRQHEMHRQLTQFDISGSNDNLNVMNIIFDSSVSRLEDYQFAGNRFIENVIIPDSVIYIGRNCFENCKNLKSVSIYAPVISVPAMMFRKCDNLESVKLRSNVQVIENGAFRESGIKQISFPSSLTQICQSAFRNCYNLNEISIPDTVIDIGDECFKSCLNLKEIRLSNSIKSVSRGCFRCCQSLSKVEIPRNVETICYSAFSKCYNLSEIKIFNDGKLRSIQDEAFRLCTDLRKICIPDTVEDIGDELFAGCAHDIEIECSDAMKDRLRYNVLCQHAINDALKEKRFIKDICIPVKIPVNGDEIYFLHHLNENAS